MTWLNPDIYNKYNLSPEDRKEIDFYEGLMDNALENARYKYKYKVKHGKNPLNIGIAKKQLKAINKVEESLSCALQEVIVSYIEAYSDEEFEKYQAAGREEREKIEFELQASVKRSEEDDE